MSDSTEVARTVWLLCDDHVLATAEVARSYAARVRGLLGRSSCDGALLLMRTRAVHTVGLRFPVDVAFLDRDLVVREMACLPPWRVALPRLRCRSVLEAEAGAFERWGLHLGDRLELREVR